MSPEGAVSATCLDCPEPATFKGRCCVCGFNNAMLRVIDGHLSRKGRQDGAVVRVENAAREVLP